MQFIIQQIIDLKKNVPKPIDKAAKILGFLLQYKRRAFGLILIVLILNTYIY